MAFAWEAKSAAKPNGFQIGTNLMLTIKSWFNLQFMFNITGIVLPYPCSGIM